MKIKLGVISFVFLTGIILGVAQPPMLYAGGETGGGTIWDPFVNQNPLKGKVAKLTGPLSIYYIPTETTPTCWNTNFHANMYYTVRLSAGFNLYTFDGTTSNICLGDFSGNPTSQGPAIMAFLETVINGIFQNAVGWNLTSVGSPGISPESLAFVADLSIEVKELK